MHKSLEERLAYKADFRVQYKFYTMEEGGRTRLPHQGYRSDFWYDYEKHVPTRIFMIWPEFEDEQGNLIMKNDSPVPLSGTARMWIVIPQAREYHRNKIRIGLKGYFM